MNKLPAAHLKAWRLFLTSHAKLTGLVDRHLTNKGQIPLNWYDVLIELFEAPEHRLRMHELAEKVVLSRSGLTRLVDRLEKEGYLTRELDPEDRRGFFAILTPEGENAMRAAWVHYAEAIQGFFATHLSEEEAQTLSQLFERFLNP